MKKLFVAMSHNLTDAQREGWDEIVEASDGLKAILRAVDPEINIEGILTLSEEVVQEAKQCRATHFCMMGEPSVFLHANLLAHLEDLHCVVATTARDTVETVAEDGTVIKKSMFRHVQWRDVFPR